MHSGIEISVLSICLTVSLICGWQLWVRRCDVPDRSRIYLVIMDFLVAVNSFLLIAGTICGFQISSPSVILDPVLSMVGLCAITLFLCYPLEVMRPRQLQGRLLLLLWLPSLLVTLPLLSGLKFQELHTWSALWEHLLEFNVLLRLLAVVFVTVFSVLLLVIPYNWRQSSADYRWIRSATFITQGISVFFYGHVFTNLHTFFILHVLWIILSMLYFTYYELHIRVIPPAKPEATVTEATEPAAARVVSTAEESGDYWPMICQVMDEWEMWRNPNTTVETVSTAVGTNRIYVARCIKEHTGMTFNDYMNEKRIAYMVSQLCLDPKQDHKHLYFDVGFRSRHTAYRNFVKFQGCSPTDFISSLS